MNGFIFVFIIIVIIMCCNNKQTIVKTFYEEKVDSA